MMGDAGGGPGSVMTAVVLLFAALGVPLAMLLLTVARPLRERMLPWLAVAPLPALAAALVVPPDLVVALDFTAGRVDGGYMPAFALDQPGALLLGAGALLFGAAGVYAARALRGTPHAGRFSACWLMALAGCVGVFVAADMPQLYLMLALMTVGATGLIFHDQTPAARRAAGTYIGLALAGETLILIAMIMLAQQLPDGSLLIRDAAAVLPTAAQRDVITALLIAGLGLKAGLLPLHVWMPLAYPAAPLPAAAVLSGIVVKAAIIGLIRFLPVSAGLARWGEWLAVIGMAGALYGVLIGVTQRDPKVVLAYSSVSQMGFTAAVIGMGISLGVAATPLLAAFYAMHHVFVKGAMFLLVGVVAAGGARNARAPLLLALLLALGMGGLPLTGGAVAKLAVKDPLGSGWAVTVAYASAVGTTLLMLHFMRCVRGLGDAMDGAAKADAALRWPWWVAGGAALVAPWVVYLALPLGTVEDLVKPEALWASAWPVAVGAALAWLLARAGDSLPRVPPGDVAVALDRGAAAFAATARGLRDADGVLRRWAVAGVSLLGLAVAFLVLLA